MRMADNSVVTTSTGHQLGLGDRFMPILHPWVGLGEIVEIHAEYPSAKAVKVKRTARSGNTRIETFLVQDTVMYFVEVRRG